MVIYVQDTAHLSKDNEISHSKERGVDYEE